MSDAIQLGLGLIGVMATLIFLAPKIGDVFERLLEIRDEIIERHEDELLEGKRIIVDKESKKLLNVK